MRSSDDTIEVPLWTARAVNPFLFKALAELKAGPGVGFRNDFIKQLAEVGLMVDEERTHREPGVSTRTAGGLTAALGDHLGRAGAGASAVASTPPPTGPVIVAVPPAQNAAAELATGEPQSSPRRSAPACRRSSRLTPLSRTKRRARPRA